MPDGAFEADETEALGRARAALSYPCGEPPAVGEAKEVASGVWWLRMPLPFALDHINVWALEDGAGLTVVDTGVGADATIGGWRAALKGPLDGRPVTRLIVTHMHPDHMGLAGWFTQEFGCRLWMTRLEYVTGRMLVADTGRPAPEEGALFLLEAGWSPEQIEDWRVRFGGFGKAVRPMPNAYRRIEDGERISVGGETWRVVVGDGHSPEHACLLRESDGVVISGDQVLPRISSNVSVWPTEPDADPLSDWLRSLDKLKRELPEDALVLPSHGEPFRGLHDRLGALTRGHERSLERLKRLLHEPRRAVDVFGALFGRPIGPSLLGLATGEALAHLNCLAGRGRAYKTLDDQGVAWWRATATEGEEA